MTRDDIIRMAREANRYASNQTSDSYDWQDIRDERFAAIVAAAEREACAQILDRNVAVCGNNTPMRDVLTGNALAIRARGQA